MSMFDSFSTSVKNLRNKIKLDEEKHFYKNEEGFYHGEKSRKGNKMVTKTITIYFDTAFEKSTFEDHFKVNKAITENISGHETKKLMQLIFLLERGIIELVPSANVIMIKDRKTDTVKTYKTTKFFDRIQEAKENEKFF